MEIRLAAALPASWPLHHHVPTGSGGRSIAKGYPTTWVLDIANPVARVAVEVDGLTHRLTAQKAIDRRKEDSLMSRAWRVVRVSNEEVQANLEGCVEFITAVAARPAADQTAKPW
jgi:hypothetical protein